MTYETMTKDETMTLIERIDADAGGMGALLGLIALAFLKGGN